MVSAGGGARMDRCLRTAAWSWRKKATWLMSGGEGVMGVLRGSSEVVVTAERVAVRGESVLGRWGVKRLEMTWEEEAGGLGAGAGVGFLRAILGDRAGGRE